MPQYQYRALTNDGRLVTGSLAASARADAVAQLREQGVRPLRLEETGGKNGKSAKIAENGKSAKNGKSASRVKSAGMEQAETKSKSSGLFAKRIKRRDIQVFTTQLASLLKAGIVMSQALSILAEECENPAMAEVVREIHADIIGGASLSDSLAKHPRYFSGLYCNMVRVGESGGILDMVMKQIGSFMEAEAELRSNIATAMAYPVLVVIVGIASIALLVWFVIPRLSSVFADFGGQLPILTRILIGVSDFMVAWGWIIVLLVIAGGYFLRNYVQTPQGRESVDYIKERIPVLGAIFIKAEIARFARTMSVLVKSGIPVLNALNLVTETTSSTILAKSLRQASDKVKRGEGLAAPLRETGFFPSMVINLISVGEQSGSLDDMLLQVADTYDVEVQHAIKRFITIFEPLVIVLMAIGVGGVLFAFLLPIMNIGQVIG
jgi:type IV pilus assembly protein PilC